MFGEKAQNLLNDLWIRLVTLRWNAYASSYEEAVQKARYSDGELRSVAKALNESIAQLQGYQSGQYLLRILDVGCGTGYLSSAIPPPRYLVGVDVSKSMIQHLQNRKINEADSYQYAELHQQDAVAYLRSAATEFDIIVACSSVQFFSPPMLDSFLEQSSEKLSPRGKIIFSFDVSIDKVRLNSKGFWEYPVPIADSLIRKYFDQSEIHTLEFTRIERGKRVLGAVASMSLPKRLKG
jgi:predicted TPR repeat methyltransferase